MTGRTSGPPTAPAISPVAPTAAASTPPTAPAISPVAPTTAASTPPTAVAATAPSAMPCTSPGMPAAPTAPPGASASRSSLLRRLTQHEDINFLLTNRIPRRWLTLLVGRVSRIQSAWFCAACIMVWRRFSDLDLSEAKLSRFDSLQQCFTRELKQGMRPIDGDAQVIVSPCDALVGATGLVEAGAVLQAKGFPYPLLDLLGDPGLVDYYRGGRYATLRLTSSMYHRFHAPYDCRVEQVDYVSGDTWNVNPIALRRIERLFCKNERAIIRCRLPGGALLTLVPVAAILVASIRLSFLDVRLHLKYRGPHRIRCDAAFAKGEEMGWFEHGSTILVFAPRGTELHEDVAEGARVNMGRPLMRHAPAAAVTTEAAGSRADGTAARGGSATAASLTRVDDGA